MNRKSFLSLPFQQIILLLTVLLLVLITGSQASADLLVVSDRTDAVLRYDDRGNYQDTLSDGEHEGYNGAIHIAYGPDGELYLSRGYSNAVHRYNRTTRRFEVFTSGGEPAFPHAFTWTPDGKFYVAHYGNGTVQCYDGKTGQYLQTIVTGLPECIGLTSDSAGNLYISNRARGVYKYQAGTLRLLVPDANPEGVYVLSDGNLYVGNRNNRVLRYRLDGTPYGANGNTTNAELASIAALATAGVQVGDMPTAMALGADGYLYVGSYGSQSDNSYVLRFHPVSGQFAGVFIHPSAHLQGAYGLTFTASPSSSIDLNQNGKPDLLWQNTQTGDTSYWLMNGVQPVSFGLLASSIPLDWRIVATPDVDRDGNYDLLWQNRTTGDVSYWLMNGTQIRSYGFVAFGVPTDWEIVATPDLNKDQNFDLLWRNKANGAVSYWLMDGTTPIGYRVLLSSSDTNWRIKATLDMNNDGYTDILWQNEATGDLVYWLMNGVQWVSHATLFSHVPLEWKIAGRADLNGDGKMDLLWRNQTTGAVSYWLMNGTNILQWGIIHNSVPLAWQIVGLR